MKKIFTLSVLLALIKTLCSQIPNAGFELWDNQPVPLQWETNSRPLTLPPWDPYIVRQDTERYSGNYAANFWANGMFKAYAKTTFPVSYHPLSLSLYYKSNFAPCVNDLGYPQKDTISVSVELLNSGTVVDAGYWESITTSFNYSQLVIPISQNASVFDSCRITIWGGQVFGGCGIIAAATEFKVDQLELNYPSACTSIGTVVQSLSCLFIDTGNSSLLLPCNVSLSALGFSVGDTIHFSYVLNSCASICMQGTGIDITCIDTSSSTICSTSVSLNVHHPTSHVANNGSIQALVSGAAFPVIYLWNTGETTDSISNLGDGFYCVIVTDQNGCSASACDSLYGPHICIDSALICNSCPCLAVYDPVCGCDSVTYSNDCFAQIAGVTSWSSGVCGSAPDSCIFTGVVVEGVECLLIADFFTSTILMPCSLPVGTVLHLGDTISYNYTLGSCISICQQGTEADFTCFEILWSSDTAIQGGDCAAKFGFSRLLDTAMFYNQSTAANISAYSWNFGDNTTSTATSPVHIFPGAGSYYVCLTITGTDSAGNNCTDTFCDSVFISHDCIDSALLCGFPLCCDFIPLAPVCGCDSVTYSNSCTARGFYGVTSYYIGPCVSTGINNTSSTGKGIRISPNPAKDILNVSYETVRSGKTEIRITNLLGQEVKFVAQQEEAGIHNTGIGISELPGGVYLLEVKTGIEKKLKKFAVE